MSKHSNKESDTTITIEPPRFDRQMCIRDRGEEGRMIAVQVQRKVALL